jgi:subtilisin family serine protease
MVALKLASPFLTGTLIAFSLFSQHENVIDAHRHDRIQSADQRSVIFYPDIGTAQTVVSDEEMQKLDPLFVEVLSQTRRGMQKQIPGLYDNQLPVGLSRLPDGTLIFDAIIYFKDPGRIRAAGVHLITETLSFGTARITIDQIERLAGIPEVSYIDPGSISFPAMDMSYYDTGIQFLHSGWINHTPYTGEGVILVIFDTGVDWSHPDFFDPADSTKSRIRYLWDVTLSPQGGEQSPGGSINYGVEYTREDIEAARAGNGTVRSFDTNSHGTHVLGTAAGSGVRYPGVAPGAEIVVIRGGVNSFSEVDIINGLQYARQKSDELGMPVVINFSLGRNSGPHDGTSAYEMAIDFYSQDPGYVVVVAAGNVGNIPMHKSGSVSPDDTGEITLIVPAYEPALENNNVFLEVWFQGNPELTATVTSPSGIMHSQSPDSMGGPDESDDGTIFLRNHVHPSNNHRTVSLDLSLPAEGIWTLGFTGVAEHIEYDVWMSRYSIGTQPVSVTLQDGNTDMTIGSPASAHEAISVGSYVTKSTWVTHDTAFVGYISSDSNPLQTKNISGFSSRGPTRDGRLKPEIAAPGQGIGAALSREIDSPFNLILLPGGKHIIYQGTSMAAPHVTGVVALLLSVNPQLTASEIKNILTMTSRVDQYTGTTPNNTWGYGKLDALKALLNILPYDIAGISEVLEYHGRLSGTVDVTDSSPLAVRFTPSITGRVSGLSIYTHVLPPDNNILYADFYTSINGVPGDPIGDPIQIHMNSLFERYYNHLDFINVDITVSDGSDYFVVFSTDDEEARIPLIYDTGHNQSGRTIVRNGESWQPIVVSNTEREIAIRVGVTEIEGIVTYADERGAQIPEQIVLYQNYPNPFNPSTTIRFSIPDHSRVELTVYDILGRKVATLIDDELKAGEYSHSFDAGHLASGVYIYRLHVLDHVHTKRLLLVK